VTSPAGPAIVLLAHGSPDPRHREGVEHLAGAVRALAPGRAVHTAYLDHHPPSPQDAAAEVRSGRAVVVPVLLTPAYHVRVDVPGAVTAMKAAGHARFEVTAALGPDPLLLDAAEEVLAAAGIVPSPRTGVVLYAAGSSDSGAVATVTETLTRHPRRGWGPWAVAALDGGPVLGEAAAALRTSCERRVAVSFMVAGGVLRDRMVSACEQAGIPMVAGTLGEAPSVARLVVRRAEGGMT
jgi:sirohydrochlorin ferrochelatase